MKIEKKPAPPVFQPVTITIESKEELKELVGSLGRTTGCYDLWKQLRDLLNA